jgi:hypothetical protein
MRQKQISKPWFKTGVDASYWDSLEFTAYLASSPLGHHEGRMKNGLGAPMIQGNKTGRARMSGAGSKSEHPSREMKWISYSILILF